MSLNRRITHVSITLDPVSRRCRVSAPYSTDFIDAAKQVGGKWDGTSHCWSFALEHERQVRALCLQVYGTVDGVPTPTREALEARLAMHLAAVVELQNQLAALDGDEEPA